MNPKYTNLEQRGNVQTATCATLHRGNGRKGKRAGAMRKKKKKKEKRSTKLTAAKCGYCCYV